MSDTDRPWHNGPARDWLGPAAAGAGPLAVYLATAARHVLDGDSAVLAAQAYRLGLAHPPGYPLMGLLGKAVTTCLPFGTLAWRANAVAALAAAASLALGCVLLRRWGVARAVAVLAMWLLGFSPLFWSQALHANPYIVAVATALGVMLLLDVWAARRAPRLLAAAAFVYGLGMGGHPSLALHLPAVGVFAALHLRRQGWRRAVMGGLIGVAAAAAGCAIWLAYDLCYLVTTSPASASESLGTRLAALLTASGSPSDWRQFFTGVATAAYPVQLALHAARAVAELSPAGVLLALAGAIALARRRWDALLLVGLGYLAQANLAATLRHWHHYDVYRLPCCALQALLMGVGLNLAWARVRTVRWRTVVLAAAAVLVLGPPYGALALSSAGPLRHVTPRSPWRNEFARLGHVDGLGALGRAEAGATVVANHGPYGTLCFLQEVEGAGVGVRLEAGFGPGGARLRALLAGGDPVYAYLRRDETAAREGLARCFEMRETLPGALHTLYQVLSCRVGKE
mgnify:CR=1 FL=1